MLLTPYKDHVDFTLNTGNWLPVNIPACTIHGGQLDYEVVKSIVFRGYSTPNFDREITL